MSPASFLPIFIGLAFCLPLGLSGQIQSYPAGNGSVDTLFSNTDSLLTLFYRNSASCHKTLYLNHEVEMVKQIWFWGWYPIARASYQEGELVNFNSTPYCQEAENVSLQLCYEKGRLVSETYCQSSVGEEKCYRFQLNEQRKRIREEEP